MKRTALFWIAIVALSGTVAYYIWEMGRAPLAPVPVVHAPIPPVSAARPVVLYPIDTPAGGEDIPLPALDESDEAFGDALAQLLGVQSLPAFLYPDSMIRRFVATVDNLPRRRLPARLMPLKPVAGPFAVSGTDGRLSIAPENSTRYRRYVDTIQAIDATKLVDVYARFYPLFQQAYVELGYPKGYFNDRLVEAIDDLLAASETSHPVGLVRPSVMYKFSDAELESLPAGQKMLIRMGSANAERMKTALRALRTELVSRAPASS